MKQLITAQVGNDDDGYKLQLQVRGDEETHSFKDIKFRPYLLRNKLISRDPENPSTVTNESVFFTYIKAGVKIPDKLGGNACGRTFPSWEGVKSFPKEKQEAQKKIAGYYWYLFGEAYFPNAEPVLVNFRMTAQIYMSFKDAVEEALGKDHNTWPDHLLKLSVKPIDKLRPHIAKVEFGIEDSTADADEVEKNTITIQEFINFHDSEIINAASV